MIPAVFRRRYLAVAIPLIFSGMAHAEAPIPAPDDGLETIVVTAQKFQSDKQLVPRNVSVFTETELAALAVDDLESVIMMSANINSNRMDSHTQAFTFRGIGGTANMNKVYYVNLDGVAVPYVATDTLLDVELIELLRGGQGALYGRNSHTGIINVTTKQPEFSEPLFKASVGYESNNSLNASVIADTMVSEQLGMRVALGHKQSDSYINNRTLGSNDSNASEQTSARLKLAYEDEQDKRLTFGLYLDRFDAGFDQYGQMGKPVSTDSYNNQPGSNNGDLISPTLTYQQPLNDNWSLTSISNYSHSSYGFIHDWDFSEHDFAVGNYDEQFDVVSQELRFGFDDKRMQGILGLFGRYENLDTKTRIDYGLDNGMGAGIYESQQSNINTTSLAAFGQGVYQLHPQWELTAALRLDYERKQIDWQNRSTYMGTPGGLVESASDDWLAVSPTASLAFIQSQQRWYLSLARGFKAGDYNNVMTDARVKPTQAVDPEFTLTYELGYKGLHLDNRLELNSALFYIDWTDMQVDTQIPGHNMLFQKENAAEAHSSGLEVETRYRHNRNWLWFANLGYMFDYQFDQFQMGDNDIKGNKLPYTNEYTVNLGGRYESDLGWFAAINANWRGGYYLIEDNSGKQDAYWLLNAQLGYQADRWRLALYGRNLLDARYAVSSFSGALAAGEPMMIGANFSIEL